MKEQKIEQVKKLFDVEDITDIEKEVKIGRGKQDIFGQQLFELFTKAYEAGIETLNVNQVTVAYQRYWVKEKGAKSKSNVQIMNKLFAMAHNGKYMLEKIDGEQGTYRLKENA